MRKGQRLRHWKQCFSPNAEFVWAKYTLFNGVPTVPGVALPSELASKQNKVRRLWDSGFIKLAHFDAPDVTTGQVTTEVPSKTIEPVIEAEPDPVQPLDSNARRAMFDGSK